MKRTIIVIIVTAFVLLGILFLTSKLGIISATDNKSRISESELFNYTTDAVDSQYTEIPREVIEQNIISKLQAEKDFIPRKQIEYIFINEANHGMDGLFIRYYQVIDSLEYSLQGIRLYEKKGDEYQLSYDNPNAWMCDGCSNCLNPWLGLSSDTLEIGMSWGPHQGAHTIYDFKYNKVTRHWQLVVCNERPVKHSANIYLENLNAETTEDQGEIYENMYKDLDDLYKILLIWDNPEGEELSRAYFMSEFDHQLYMRTEDIHELVDKMTDKDYSTALECARILQKNMNSDGLSLLEQIISKYPNHPLESSAEKLLKKDEQQAVKDERLDIKE